MKTLELPFPDCMTAAERAREIATIVATAIVRTHPQEIDTESSFRLGFSAGKRVHTTPLNAGDWS